MGYSHYWKIEKDMHMQEFKHLQTVAAKIVEASDASVDLSINTSPLYPSITVEGMASDAHETFYLTPKAVEFEFCKTARKPYDEVVVGILDYADALGLLEFTSDGNFDDLAAGRKLADEYAPDQVSLLLGKIEKIVFQPTTITGDSRRDLDNLVALMRREVDSNDS